MMQLAGSTAKGKRILIVGGSAGGATAAVRARQLSEDADITLFEQGAYVSYSSCGLPYYLGREVRNRDDITGYSAKRFRDVFNIRVRLRHRVVSIDREAKEIEVLDLQRDQVYREPYDDLVLAVGAKPIRPNIPGIDRPGSFVLRSIQDVDNIMAWIVEHMPIRAVIIGGGYIGVEMAEQLRKRRMNVTLVEANPQILSFMDPEMVAWLQMEMRSESVTLHLGQPVTSIEAPAHDEYPATSAVLLANGTRIAADLIILGSGVKPDVQLARDAGLAVGDLGGIRVNDHLQTSDPHIWAVGDVIEVMNPLTGHLELIPLAGPANRQGRIAADNILGRHARYGGSYGTAILRVFGLTAAAVGLSETDLLRCNLPYQALHLHASSHSSYYPGAEALTIKLLFRPDENGRVVGAQVVGQGGVDKRIDVLATAICSGLTVQDLAELDLAYSPPYSSPKDPVNLAGMIGTNIFCGDLRVAQWYDIKGDESDEDLILDVRTEKEYEDGHIPGAVVIPLNELRGRLDELPKEQSIVVYCQGGQRSYYAYRILVPHGYKVRHLTGGFLTWKAVRDEAAKKVATGITA